MARKITLICATYILVVTYAALVLVVIPKSPDLFSGWCSSLIASRVAEASEALLALGFLYGLLARLFLSARFVDLSGSFLSLMGGVYYYQRWFSHPPGRYGTSESLDPGFSCLDATSPSYAPLLLLSVLPVILAGIVGVAFGELIRILVGKLAPGKSI